MDPGQRPLRRIANGYTSGEEIDGTRYDWDSNSSAPAGPSWVAADSPIREDADATANQAFSADAVHYNPWGLVPDALPPMEYAATSAGEAVRASLAELNVFPSSPVTVPPGSHIHILLDRRTLTTAYPALTVSGGKGARIALTYAEALYDGNHHKGDRDAVGDRSAVGITDSLLLDGGPHRTFETLWWRTWRYLDLDIQTASEPVHLESLTASFTAYPFRERATFNSGDPDLAKIWEISWRTARLGAHETYMDTPYWEQL